MAWSGRFDDMYLENLENVDNGRAWKEKQSRYKMSVQKNASATSQSVIQTLQQGITINVSFFLYIILSFKKISGYIVIFLENL